MTPLGIISAFGGVLGLGGVVGAVIIYARVSGLQTSITMLTTANTGLREANEDGKNERASMREEFTAKLHEQELECARQIALLEGQVGALTSGLANQIVGAVTAVLQTTPGAAKVILAVESDAPVSKS